MCIQVFRNCIQNLDEQNLTNQIRKERQPNVGKFGVIIKFHLGITSFIWQYLVGVVHLIF